MDRRIILVTKGCVLWRKNNLKWFDGVLFFGIIFKQAELAVGSW